MKLKIKLIEDVCNVFLWVRKILIEDKIIILAITGLSGLSFCAGYLTNEFYNLGRTKPIIIYERCPDCNDSREYNWEVEPFWGIDPPTRS